MEADVLEVSVTKNVKHFTSGNFTYADFFHSYKSEAFHPNLK